MEFNIPQFLFLLAVKAVEIGEVVPDCFKGSVANILLSSYKSALLGEVKLIPVYYMGIVTGWGCTFCLRTVVGEGWRHKDFLTHYLVLSPGLLYVDTVILGLLLCL